MSYKMDFRKLNPDELSSFFRMYLVQPTGDPYVYALELFNHLGPQGKYPEAIVDLYIAYQLKKQGISIPVNYDSDKLNTVQFLELAKILNLPVEDTPMTRERAKRIIRILSPIQIISVGFTGPGKYGDFGWMIQQPEYQDVLFLFNDNQEQFVDFLLSRSACMSGGGNAVIRPYQCINPPRAAGIPTGSSGRGYQDLRTGQQYIDEAFEVIKRLLSTGKYKTVMYSGDKDGRLGASIFSPSSEVIDYITNKIRQL